MGPPGVRADQHVGLKADIVRDGGGPAPLPAPPLFQYGLCGLPPVPVPPVEEDGDLLAASVGVLEELVQMDPVPRHDQQVAHGRVRGCGSAAVRWVWHRSPSLAFGYDKTGMRRLTPRCGTEHKTCLPRQTGQRQLRVIEGGKALRALATPPVG
jgi:hypothetical protein